MEYIHSFIFVRSLATMLWSMQVCAMCLITCEYEHNFSYCIHNLAGSLLSAPTVIFTGSNPTSVVIDGSGNLFVTCSVPIHIYYHIIIMLISCLWLCSSSREAMILKCSQVCMRHF
jgi:hypothetical protein